MIDLASLDALYQKFSATETGDAVADVSSRLAAACGLAGEWPSIREALVELERLRAFVADLETAPLNYPPSYPRAPSVSLDDLFDDEKPEDS